MADKKQKVDKELEDFRNIMDVPNSFEEGFTWSSFSGALFIALVMVPGALYMGLVAGEAVVGPAAQWVTIILFIEVAKRAHKQLKTAEIALLYFMASWAMAMPFSGLLWNQYYIQSEAAIGAGIAEGIPFWWAPDPSSSSYASRSFFTLDWLPVIGLVVFTAFFGQLKGLILGYGLFKVASDYEKLPFPMAPMQAMGIMAMMQKALAFGAKAWAVAQWGLNAALNASPIGLVVLGVMALIAVVALGIKYWEPLGEFFTNLWDGIVNKFTGAMEIIGALVGQVAGWWNSLFGDDETTVKNIAMNGQVTTSGSSPALAASGGVMPYQAKTGISASRGASNTYQNENKIKIVQQPGESQEDLARRVAEEMDRRERGRARHQRGALYD